MPRPMRVLRKSRQWISDPEGGQLTSRMMRFPLLRRTPVAMRGRVDYGIRALVEETRRLIKR